MNNPLPLGLFIHAPNIPDVPIVCGLKANKWVLFSRRSRPMRRETGKQESCYNRDLGPGQRAWTCEKNQIPNSVNRSGWTGTAHFWGPEVGRRSLCNYSENPRSYQNAFSVLSVIQIFLGKKRVSGGEPAILSSSYPKFYF